MQRERSIPRATREPRATSRILTGFCLVAVIVFLTAMVSVTGLQNITHMISTTDPAYNTPAGNALLDQLLATVLRLRVIVVVTAVLGALITMMVGFFLAKSIASTARPPGESSGR